MILNSDRNIRDLTFLKEEMFVSSNGLLCWKLSKKVVPVKLMKDMYKAGLFHFDLERSIKDRRRENIKSNTL